MTTNKNDFFLRQQFLGQLPGNVLAELVKTSAEKQDMEWLLPMEAAGIFRLSFLIKSQDNKDLFVKQGFPILESLTFALKGAKCSVEKEDPFTGKKIDPGAGIYQANIKPEYHQMVKRISESLINDTNEQKEPEAFNEIFENLKKRYSNIDQKHWVQTDAKKAAVPLIALGCAMGDREIVELFSNGKETARDSLFPQSMVNVNIPGVTHVSPVIVAMAYGKTDIVKDLIDSGWSHRSTCAFVKKGIYPNDMSYKNMLQLLTKFVVDTRNTTFANEYPFFLPSSVKELIPLWKNPAFGSEELVDNLHLQIVRRKTYSSYMDAMFEAGALDRNTGEIIASALINENFAAANLLMDRFDWKPWAAWNNESENQEKKYSPANLPFVRLCRSIQAGYAEDDRSKGKEENKGPGAPNLPLDQQISKWCQAAINNGAGHLLAGDDDNCLATMFAQIGLFKAVSLCIEQGFDPESAGHDEDCLVEMSWKSKPLEEVIVATERKMAALNVLSELDQLIHAMPG